jgi:hypothetical protein
MPVLSSYSPGLTPSSKIRNRFWQNVKEHPPSCFESSVSGRYESESHRQEQNN